MSDDGDVPITVDFREQPRALEHVGFSDVELLHDEGNLALWRGSNPAS